MISKTLITVFSLLIATTCFASEIKVSQLGENTTAPKIEQEGAGVAVSPAHIHFNVEPGESKTYKVTVNNDTKVPNKFKLSFNDFNMNGYGKSEFLPAGSGENSLSKWASVSPSFIELNPGEKREVVVTVSVPYDDPMANKAAWCILLVEQAEERKTIDPGADGDKIAFGVIPTFAFGVFIYQNPPTVEVNKVDIINFRHLTTNNSNALAIDVENIGDGITYCSIYVEVTNLKTGASEKVAVKKFTIVPGLKREFNFPLPEGYPKGTYSAVGVLDFGSDEELQAAELEFTL